MRATSANLKEVAGLFKFLADNTSVEWVIHAVGSDYTLGTIHKNGSAGSWMDYCITYPEASLHSHPGELLDNELYSMGYGSPQYGDIQNYDIEYGSHVPPRRNYVYFPISKHIYRIEEGRQKPRIITSAKSTSQITRLFR